jgi:VWFA-related protein
MRRFGILAIVVAAALAQQTDTLVKFSATSNLVIVDVTVRDRSGKPIEGLKRTDFTVMEDGKPQKMAVFEFQNLSMEPAAPEASLTLEEQQELPQKVQQITVKSAGQVQYQDKRLLVLFFDFGSMSIPDQLRAQDSAMKFLDTQMTASDLVAIMTNKSKVKVEQDFTADRTLLKQIVKDFPIGQMSELAEVADDADEEGGEDTGAAFVADETEFNIFNSDRRLAALENAVKKLGVLPEKKALVYFSSGVGKTGMENQAQLRSTINAAQKANVAFFPIDARGLIAAPPGGDASRAAPRGTGIYSGHAQNQERARINDQQETLSSLAADTGGKMFIDNNELSLGIAQAQKEIRSYYVIGYYSTNNASDGRYRRIQVKVNAKNARVEHRQGYYAEKVWGVLNSADKEQQLTDAMNAGDPATELPLALEVNYFRVAHGAYFVPIAIKIPGSFIALAQKKAGGATELDIVGQVLDDQRRAAGSVRDGIKIKLSQENAAKITRRSFQYDTGFTLAPGKYRMKFVVRDNQSGKLGTFDTRFVIPDLATDTSGLKLSSVVWSAQREPVKSAVGSAEKISAKVLEANPTIVNGEKLIPSITRVFRRDQNMYVLFDVYDPAFDLAGQGPRLAVSMSLYKDSAKVFETSPLKLEQMAPTRPDAAAVQLMVPLKGLAPGRYICQLNVVDEIGRKFAFPRAAVVLQ